MLQLEDQTLWMVDLAEEEVLAEVGEEVELVAVVSVVLLVDVAVDLVDDVEMEKKMMSKADQNSYMDVDIKSEMETGFTTQTTRLIHFL